MYFNDFKQNIEVANEKELVALLQKRYSNNSNHFILSHNASGLPELSFFVKENVCVAYYIVDDDFNYVSQSNLDLEKNVMFYENDTGAETILSKDCVIRTDCIETACVYFFKYNKIPPMIDWEEL